MKMECKHKRHKRNYPFGKKSKALIICKDCGVKIDGKWFKENRIIKKRSSSKT